MTRSATLGLVAWASFLTLVSPAGRAEPIVAGDTTFVGRAIQDVTLLAGTPINPSGPEFTLYGLYGDGSFTIHRSAESGNSIAFVGGDALYSGTNQYIGSYTFGTGGSVGIGSFHGSIDNVTQNPGDPGYASGDPSSFASGDYTAHLTRFYFKLADGTILETGGDYILTATLDGLPPRTTAVLQGSATYQNPIYLGDPSNGILVGYTTNGSIVVNGVPEPSSLALLAAGAGLGLCLHRRLAGVSRQTA